MAHRIHRELITEDPLKWNEYRLSRPDEMPDLQGMRLYGVDLHGINLRNAWLANVVLDSCNLNDADFSGAKLIDCSLSHSTLTDAMINYAVIVRSDLADVDLKRAQLIGVYFTESILHQVELTGAVLRGAVFAQSDLRGANFYGADLEDVTFSSSNLQQTQGLDTPFRREVWGREVSGKVLIDFETIRQSPGLPRKFLEMGGLSAVIYDYLPSLGASFALEFYSCFLSHSSRDRIFVERLYQDLRREGVRCWYSHEDLKIGDRIRDEIDRAIRFQDKLLVVLSTNVLDSDWVEDEVGVALEEERKSSRQILFPIRIDESIMQTEVSWVKHLRLKRHIGDFTQWQDPQGYQHALGRLLRDVQGQGSYNHANREIISI